MSREIILEESVVDQLSDIYDELSDLKNALFFLNCISQDENLNDSYGEGFQKGRAFILQNLTEKLTEIMKQIKSLMKLKEDE